MKNRVRSLFVTFLLGASLFGYGQDGIDELKAQIAKQGDDTVKVNNLISLATQLLGEDPQETITYGTQAQQLAHRLVFPKGEAYARKAIGLGHYYQANYPEAAIQFQTSLDIFDSLNFQVGVANILSNLGSTYFNAGENTKAIDFYLRSLRISEELNDSLRIGTALNGVGGVYNNNPATEGKALEYFLRALPIFKAIGYDAGIGIVSMNVGEIYEKRKLYDSAIYYLDESLEVYRGTIDATFPLNLLGRIYAERNDFTQAMDYHQKALQIARELDAKLEIAQSLVSMATTLNKQKKYRAAIDSYREAEKIASEISARIQLKEVYEGLSKNYAQLGEYENAYQYHQLLGVMKDTLYNTNNDKKLQQLQFNFDLEKKEAEIDLLTKDQALKDATIQRQRIVNYAVGITGFLLLFLVYGFYNRYKFVRKTNKIIKAERDRSKDLLLNILPEETARELEESGYAKTRHYENVTVLFTDFKGFSSIASTLTPIELVAELNDYFIAFDEIVGQYGLEKIKTIGDAYMCAGGIPTTNTSHPLDAVHAAMAMQAYIRKRQNEHHITGIAGWELRVGIHTGPVVAGVVGKKKYAYDIWGDTVNVASRMESNSEPGRVNISATTYEAVKDHYRCTYRGKISAKNIGEVDMYFVDGPQ